MQASFKFEVHVEGRLPLLKGGGGGVEMCPLFSLQEQLVDWPRPEGSAWPYKAEFALQGAGQCLFWLISAGLSQEHGSEG